MVQTALCDGGIVSQPYHHFMEHESIYRYIENRLDGTRRSYLESDTDTRLRLLLDITNYAMLTANTPLEQADRSFEIYLDHYPNFDPQSLAITLAENGIGFYNNKARYIHENYNNLDDLFVRVDNLLGSGRENNAQDVLMEASGIGPAKSAFSLAMLGFTDHACIDTHVAQQLGLDPRVYERFDATQYKELVEKAFSQVPELKGEISPFLLQWVLFDLNRGYVETHDHWFEHVTRLTS